MLHKEARAFRRVRGVANYLYQVWDMTGPYVLSVFPDYDDIFVDIHSTRGDYVETVQVPWTELVSEEQDPLEIAIRRLASKYYGDAL